MSTATWTDRQREVLSAVADLLIPEDGEMPAASAVGTGQAGIDEIAAIRPDLLVAGRDLVEILDQEVPSSIEDLRAAAPHLFTSVSELLASAYFLRPEVARLLGYRSRVAIPLDNEMLRKVQLEELVGPVVARGNVWRRTEGR